MTKFTREDLIQAIYGQESSHGKADTSQENYAGARGPMQVTASTFDGMKNKGLIPANFQHDNPEHTREAGNRLVGYLFDKYGGDEAKVAAAYYAGEKAVRADGSIANFRDKKNPKAPTTHQYVADIQKRLGIASQTLPDDTPAGDPVARSSVLASWDDGMPDRSAAKARREPKAVDTFTATIQPSVPLTGDGVMPLADQIEVEEQILRKEGKKRDETTFLEQSKAAFIQNTFVGSVIRNRAITEAARGLEPVPGFRVDPKELEGMSSEEQEFMLQATNPVHAGMIRYQIEDRRDQLNTINIKGTGTGIAATLFAGLPEGYLTGMGAMKAFQLAKVGSLQLAARGARGAALASAAAENIGANVALTAVQDSFDPYVNKSDYAMAVGGGVLGMSLTAPSVFGAAGRAEARARGVAMQEKSAAETLAVREKAAQNLGTSATPEALQAEVKRLEANKVRSDLAAMRAEVPENRRLLPQDDELRVDAAPAAESSVMKADPTQAIQQKFKSETPTEWTTATPERDAYRKQLMSNQWSKQLAEVEGVNQRWIDKQAVGVTVLPELAKNARYGVVVEAAQALQKKFLPNSKLVMGVSKITDAQGGKMNPSHEAIIYSAGDSHAVGLRDNLSTQAALVSTIHEIGHAVFHENARHIPAPLLRRMVEEHQAFMIELRSNKPQARFKRFAEGSESLVTPEGQFKGNPLSPTEYVSSFDEYTAEAFTRYMQRNARNGDTTLPEKAITLMRAAWDKVKALYDYAMGRGWLAKDEAFDEFFDRVAAGNLRAVEKEAAEEFLDPSLTLANFNKPGDPADIVNDPVAVKNGLALMPVETTTQQAEAKAMIALYKKANEGGYKVDDKRLSKLMETSVFQGAQGTANTMLRSKNPVVRMIASELLESAGGAGGRRATAAIAKHMNEKAYLGNTLNEVQSAYTAYRNSQGESIVGDFFNGKQWEQFNRMVAEEIESRRPGAPSVESPPAVKQAADSLEKAYDRMRVAQANAKTVGWGALPTSSTGYMPHKLSPEKFVNMSSKQADALHKALVDQFISIEGFDISFAQNLATKYMDRVRVRAYGGFDAPIGAHQPGAADLVEEALEQMGMDRMQVTAMMKKYMAGGAGHTKKRLSLDLNAEHDLGDGTTFKLLDLFESDQFKLLRSQAQRVSGEVALAGHGVMGKPGLKLLRRAMQFGADGERATARELEAFDQVAAEFMGDSFGTQSKLADRVMQVNSLARLGGMGFTQFGEAINGIFHVGALRTLDAVTSMGRLRSEIKALARGEEVKNPIIGSIERYSGVEFGTDAYKTVFPFDNSSLEYHTYGKDTVTAADRLLRGGTFVQGKLSMWRTIHSTQQRGMAEQIVRKAADYIKNGGNDVALRDMGMSDELISKLRKDIDNVAEFEGGRLTNFDITKATDAAAANEFIQSIHRGVSQIIQGTFIGETGKWTHDGMMRVMTQFRTFSLTSIEKQWARQVGNVGTAKALGMMLGAMSIAAPIYMARTYLASIGRHDQEAYLEKQLSAAQIARASLNYIAMSGLAGDFLDATTAVTGVGKVTGGRTGSGSEFVGNVVAPAAGLADDVWRGMQNTKEGTDPHELVKALPFSRLPFLIPAINALDSD